MEVHTREDYERALRFREIMENGFWLGGNDKESEGPLTGKFPPDHSGA